MEVKEGCHFFGEQSANQKKRKKEKVNFAKSKVETKIPIYFIITILNTHSSNNKYLVVKIISKLI